MKLVAIVGMAGSGKSEVARIFEEHGFSRIRFGDLTDREAASRGLELNEENERTVREDLRREHGMAAYAMLNIPEIDSRLETSDVVLDGLYSWEEYILLKKHYGDSLKILAVWSAPETRYERLAGRHLRGRTREEAVARDRAEIENINKGGPIAMADFTIKNESDMIKLIKNTEKVIGRL